MTEKTIEIQRKMLGVLMRNARQRVGLTVPETASLLGLDADTLTAYELGKAEAGLPTLEALAEICRVPVSYFWADDALPDPTPRTDAPHGITLRRKMLGVLLAQARRQADVSAEDAAQAIGVSADALAEMELGKADVPFSQLKALLPLYKMPLDELLAEVDIPVETNGKTEPAPAPQETFNTAELAHFPPDVQEFLADPTNILYVKLAMKLHNLSADNLRALAEGILEITY